MPCRLVLDINIPKENSEDFSGQMEMTIMNNNSNNDEVALARWINKTIISQLEPCIKNITETPDNIGDSDGSN